MIFSDVTSYNWEISTNISDEPVASNFRITECTQPFQHTFSANIKHALTYLTGFMQIQSIS